MMKVTTFLKCTTGFLVGMSVQVACGITWTNTSPGAVGDFTTVSNWDEPRVPSELDTPGFPAGEGPYTVTIDTWVTNAAATIGGTEADITFNITPSGRYVLESGRFFIRLPS